MKLRGRLNTMMGSHIKGLTGSAPAACTVTPPTLSPTTLAQPTIYYQQTRFDDNLPTYLLRPLIYFSRF